MWFLKELWTPLAPKEVHGLFFFFERKERKKIPIKIIQQEPLLQLEGAHLLQLQCCRFKT